MDIWLIWLIVAAVAAVLEILIPGFFMLSITAGCIGGCIASLFSSSLLVQLIAALIFLLAFALLIRPVLYRKKRNVVGPESKTIGKIVTVTKAIIPPDTGRGILHGVEWSLASEDVIKEGEKAIVKSVGGAILYVENMEKGGEKRC